MSNDLNNTSGGTSGGISGGKSGWQNSGLDDFDRLLASLFDGGMNDAQWDNLCEQMADDPHARQRYIQFVQLHSLLETRYSLQQNPTLPDGTDEANAVHGDAARELQNLARQLHTSGPIKTTVQKKKSFFAITRFSAWRIAAVLLFVASAVFALTSPLWWGWKKAAPLATLTDAVDAQWDATQENMPQDGLAVGDSLPRGPLVLQAGYARITLDNGINLVLQGPANFSVDSLTQVHLQLGKLTADVPHTVSGFTVKMPTASVTDLGTTFGVTAYLNGEATVQVLKGKVQAKLLAEDGSTKVQADLTQDHAAALNPNLGTLASIPAQPDAYATDIHHIPATPTPYARWLAYSTNLRKDPGLLAYYTFDNQTEAPQKLFNRATATASKYDGQIENAPWDEGRFPGKKCLRFNGNGSCVKINIPDPLQRLTVAIWVRVDSWKFTGLFMSDDWNKTGEVAFQLNQNRDIWGGIYNVGIGNLFSPQAKLPDELAGKWVHLVATWDAPTATAAVYCNGTLIDQQTKSPMPAICIGSAQIGNWAPLTWNPDAPPGTDFRRGLNGRIDEMAIFNRLLDASEIQAMYQAGRNEK